MNPKDPGGLLRDPSFSRGIHVQPHHGPASFTEIGVKGLGTQEHHAGLIGKSDFHDIGVLVQSYVPEDIVASAECAALQTYRRLPVGIGGHESVSIIALPHIMRNI
jgi:hypothetical protein